MYFNELSQEEIREQQYHESVERIWKMRTGYGISQKRIADFCGISRQYLSEIENHKRIVPERLFTENRYRHPAGIRRRTSGNHYRLFPRKDSHTGYTDGTGRPFETAHGILPL